METLIPVLNKLQVTFAKIGEKAIDLPQIVVVGCQSSGKSSVLESLVQKDFLPRGAGIVTRMPLILQLIHTPENSVPKEYGVFLHKDTKFTDFNAIREEIVSYTNFVCGKNGISKQPISLKIYSPNVPDLTLVDLPGLTKIATEGQPADLPDLIKSMVMDFIEKENSLILAVTPANMDLANSDSLVVAREVDPKGLRTIGVLTKIDLMDDGTDCMDVLLNKQYPLKLGYVGVINRSQKDIMDNKPMSKVIESERRFFVTNQKYKSVADQCGYPFLALTLNHILINHIKEKLPNVHSQITELLRRKQHELNGYGESIGSTVQEKQMAIYRIVEQYLKYFSDIIFGRVDLRTNGLEGGAGIVDYLINDFPEALMKLDSILKLSKEEITQFINMNTGIQPPLFFPESTFFMILRDAIEKLRPAALESAEIVFHKISEIHTSIFFPELDRFPKVKRALSDEVSAILKDTLDECQKFIETLIDIHKSYINSKNAKIFELTMNIFEEQIDQSKEDFIRALAENSFQTIRKEIGDAVGKTIVRIMVLDSVEKYRTELFKALVTHPDVSEDPDIALRRSKCLMLIDALKEAESTINETRMVHL